MDFHANLVRDAGVAIIITDLNGQITAFNAAAEQLYNYPAGEALGQLITVFTPPYSRQHQEQALRAMIHSGYPISLTLEQHVTGGSLIPVRLVMSPVRDKHGMLAALCHFVIDLSRPVAEYRALQHGRDMLEGAVETARDAILMIDIRGRIAIANFQFDEFFHIPRARLIGQPIDYLIQIIKGRQDLAQGLATILTNFRQDFTQIIHSDLEITIPEPRILNWFSAPVKGHEPTPMGRLFMFRDVTRERQVDRMKTEFVSLVSHEMRTPLTSIRGFVELILEGDAGPITDEIRNFLQIVRENSIRLTNLTRDILDLTRIEAGRFALNRAEVEIDTIIDISRNTVHHLLNERKQELVIFNYPSELPPVRADRDRLVQVLVNLLSNASKYSPPETAIRLRVGLYSPEDTLPPGLRAVISGPTYFFSVQDSGMGIPLEDQPKVFNRFYRTEQATKMQIPGSGLGLTIAKALVEHHGGQIWLHSEPGKGSTFHFTIPRITKQ